ncbi:MAG: LCP family protein [Oscillospiraceae bacterium]|nr:LCP family protein [Oscillospiraceae bacterium]
MKNKKGSRLAFSVIWTIQLVIEALTAILLWKLDMLPMKYFAVLLVLFVLGAIVTRVMMFQKVGKWQKKAGGPKRVIGCLFSVVIIVLCSVAAHAVFTLNNTFAAITGNKTVSSVIGVYVLADDPAQSIEDAAGYTFAVAGSYDAEEVQKAIDEIEETLSSEITVQNYDTSFAVVDALYAQDINAIIMSESYIDILESQEGYEDFSERTKELSTHIIEKESESSPGDTQNSKVQDPTKEPFLVYISGNDARRELLANGGSDVNILVAVNPQEKQILMVNTPRDYFVANPAGDGAKDKLSHCGLYGIDCSIEALTQLYGQPISYYAKINFSGFKTLVDALGGVTIYSDISFSTTSGTYIQAGENHLNGTEALAFARERRNLAGGDNDRGKNQMKLIAAMINQLSAGNLLANYSEILGSLEGMFATDMSTDTISSLVKMQLSDMATWDILSFAVTGSNGHDQPYALGGLYAYVMYPNEADVAHASELIGRVLNGEVLTEADLTVN